MRDRQNILDYFELPILNIPVPHVGHLPFIAGLPFLSVTGTAFGSSLFSRHFTQYIVAIILFTPLRFYIYMNNLHNANSIPKKKQIIISVFTKSF